MAHRPQHPSLMVLRPHQQPHAQHHQRFPLQLYAQPVAVVHQRRSAAVCGPGRRDRSRRRRHHPNASNSAPNNLSPYNVDSSVRTRMWDGQDKFFKDDIAIAQGQAPDPVGRIVAARQHSLRAQRQPARDHQLSGLPGHLVQYQLPGLPVSLDGAYQPADQLEHVLRVCAGHGVAVAV